MNIKCIELLAYKFKYHKILKYVTLTEYYKIGQETKIIKTVCKYKADLQSRIDRMYDEFIACQPECYLIVEPKYNLFSKKPYDIAVINKNSYCMLKYFKLIDKDLAELESYSIENKV